MPKSNETHQSIPSSEQCVFEEILALHVMPCLLPRELLNLSHASKFLLTSLTVEVATKSVMMRSETGFRSMKKLRNLSECGVIYPVEPSRILRLGLGKKCENCLNERIYPKKGSNRVMGVRDGYGNHYCWRCLTKRRHSRRLYKNTGIFLRNQTVFNHVLGDIRIFNYKCRGWRKIHSNIADQHNWARTLGISTRWRFFEEENDTIFQIRDCITYFMKEQCTDNFGTKIGPIASYDVIQSIFRDLDGKRIEDVKEIVDSHFRVLGAPELNDPKYTKLVNAFDRNLKHAVKRLLENKDKKIMAADRHVKKKIMSAENLIAKLELELNNPNLHHLLDYQVNKLYTNPKIRRQNKELPIIMTTFYINRLMLRYLKAPSKIDTKKKLHHLVNVIINASQRYHSEEDMAKLVFDHQRHSYRFIESNNIVCKKRQWRQYNIQHGDF